MKYIKPGVKGLSMIRQVSFLVAVLSVCSFAAPDSTGSRLSEMEDKVDNILSIAGIQFGGVFRSQFMYSGLDTEKPGVSDAAKTGENIDFTSVDFEIEARPNEAVGGKVIFRMHQDWRNFFSDGGNPITTRWVGIKGNVNNMFLYNIGDYKQKYSPLTLYNPQIDVDFEPEIFARKRRYAMGEAFLEDNKRILQGVNFTFAAKIEPLLEKFYAQAFGARLRLSFMDQQNYLAIGYGHENDYRMELGLGMDRYAAGFNTDMEILKNLKIGGTFLSIFDAPKTNDKDYGNSTISSKQYKADSAAAVRIISAVRGGIGTATFMDSDIFDISINGELDFSNDRKFKELDTTKADPIIYEYDNAMALKLDLLSEFKLGMENKINLNVGITANDEKYRNELAQSPTFLSQRIMNIENDIDRDGNTTALYSTYDAMYNTVFFYAPSETNKFYKAPFTKLAYTNGLLTVDEVEKMQSALESSTARDSAYREHNLFDPALQLVMPYGPATPNRVGFDGELAASFLNDGINAKVSFAKFDEKSGQEFQIDSVIHNAPKSAYTQFGGGASIDIASFIDAIDKPLRISGGMKISTAKNDGLVLAGSD
ncbi:MAG: hypothetical protein ACLFSB_02000, partial [Chitinispirillaceae bacterium]